jgi:hypothetical protein
MDVAARHEGSRPVAGTAVPGEPVRIGQGTLVESGTGELQPSRESPLAKLLGTFQKPRRIPLPRTDLPDGSAPPEDVADEAATGLAEAF